MNEESKSLNWIERKKWTFSLLALFIILVGSIAWMYHDMGFKPVLATLSASFALISHLFNKGIKGYFFILGLFTGSVLAGGLIILIPQFDAKIVDKKLSQVADEKEVVEKENTFLKNKVSEFESKPTPTPTPEPTSTPTPTPIPTPTLSSTTPSKPIKPVTVDNVLFELMICKSTGNDVETEIKVTNLGEDRQLYFSDNSAIINENGDVFKVKDDPNGRFVSNIMRRMKFTFPGAGQSKKAKLLEIKFNNESVQFRDIDISR